MVAAPLQAAADLPVEAEEGAAVEEEGVVEAVVEVALPAEPLTDHLLVLQVVVYLVCHHHQEMALFRPALHRRHLL